MRRLIFGSPLLLVVALSLTQQKPNWPQASVHGAVIVWGSDAAMSDARTAFLQTSKAGGKMLVLPAKGEDWSAVSQATVVSSLKPDEIVGTAAVWVGTSPVSADVAKALLDAKEHGAVIALAKRALQGNGLLRLLGSVSVEGSQQDGESKTAVTVRIADGAVLIANGRTVSARGHGECTFTIPGGGGYGEDRVEVTGSALADLIALERRAIERTLPPFPNKNPSTPEVKSGTLFIVSGGGLPQGLLERFIAACGGPEAPIVYVPCESAEQITTEPSFVDDLRRAGAKNVTWIHTKDRNKADKDETFLKPLKDAKGVWFGGGRQWNLVDSYMDTKAHDLMRQVLARGGAIGGSSAGASIQAELLARGDPLGNTDIIAPGYLRGLGFLPGAAVDQHFTQRDRFKDMTQLMTAYPEWLGIGLDEGTAIVVAGTKAEVAGKGNAFFYDYRTKPAGETDYLRLKAGDKYDLKARKKIEG